MSLKSRYAAFLLFLSLLLIGFCVASVFMIYQGHYVLTLVLFIVLYMCTYMLGKRFSRIFFVLSVLRLLRKNGGSLSLDELDEFLGKTLAGRKDAAAISELKNDILTTLLAEKAVGIEENVLVLLDC